MKIKLLLILFACSLSSCQNLTEAQNDRLIGVGLRIGETLLVEAVK